MRCDDRGDSRSAFEPTTVCHVPVVRYSGLRDPPQQAYREDVRAARRRSGDPLTPGTEQSGDGERNGGNETVHRDLHRWHGDTCSAQRRVESTLAAPGFALVLSAIILFATGSMQRRRGRLPLLCVLIGVAVVSTFAGVVYPFEAVAFSSLLALRRERRFLASVIAISVAMGVPIAIDLMWAGGDFILSGITALLLLLAPAAWAMWLYARE